MVNAVKTYKSTDQGAPVLTGEVGKLIDLLTAVLVDGYATASVSGITRSGSVATVTLADANSSLTTGDWVTIAGANQADYNGEHQITVTSGTTFTYAVANSPATPATGTITYKKSGAGWTKPFTGTNKAVFYPGSANNSARFYLRVDDSGGTAGGALEVAVRGYESMGDVDTGSGDFPTAANAASGLCWRKSATANSTARAWCIVADDRGFYIQINAGATAATTSVNYFGWFPSNKPGDVYNCVLTGATTFNSSSLAEGLGGIAGVDAFSALFSVSIARSYSQLGSGIGGRTVSFLPAASALGAGGGSSSDILYPNPQDSALWVLPVFVGEAGNSIRGRYPGAYVHVHTTMPFANYDKASNIAGLPGVVCMSLDCKNSSSAGQLLVDITGPWS
jgi:hypothetical protein